MKTFIYYRKNGEESEPDVAAVKAKFVNDAVKILNKYYNCVDKGLCSIGRTKTKADALKWTSQIK